jgi:hypothetical protein
MLMFLLMQMTGPLLDSSSFRLGWEWLWLCFLMHREASWGVENLRKQDKHRKHMDG